MRILLVEDDALLGEGICAGMHRKGYTVDWLRDGESAECAITVESFDLVILDLGLPKRHGLDVLKEIRRRGCEVPVLILTAQDGIHDRIAGLDAGADDYLVKPFDLEELYARLRAIVRRAHGLAENRIAHGDIELNVEAHRVTVAGKDVKISRREFAVLYELLQNRGRVLSRERLEQTLYGWDDEVESNAVEVHIHHIRKKLGNELIRTIRGVGYIIEKL